MQTGKVIQIIGVAVDIEFSQEHLPAIENAIEIDMGEGDIVRCFKRVIDVLRQFCTIENMPEDLVFTAREAIEQINRSPIDID